MLDQAVAQLPDPQLRYRVRGNQIMIGPAYQPAVAPGRGAGERPSRTGEADRSSRSSGAPVHLAVENKPLGSRYSRSCATLTGANIVLDARCKDAAKTSVRDDSTTSRLFTALTVLGRHVRPEAGVIEQRVLRHHPGERGADAEGDLPDVYGKRTPAPTGCPAGYVTDG